jgi:hypothetical protein
MGNRFLNYSTFYPTFITTIRSICSSKFSWAIVDCPGIVDLCCGAIDYLPEPDAVF